MSNNKDILEPKATDNMNKLKIETANETLGRDMKTTINEQNYEKVLDQKKWEAAEDLGLKEKIQDVGWENMTTKEVGKIGGSVGGKIGGNMVKKLIAMAEAQMAPIEEDAIPTQLKNEPINPDNQNK